MVGKIFHSPFTGAFVALGAALWQARTTGGIDEWLSLPFGAFLLAIGQSIWALVSDNRMLKERFKSKAVLQFDGNDTTIYAQPGDVEVDHVVYRECNYHVGVVNKSKETLQRLRLVLESVEPHIDHAVYLGKAMRVRGEASPDGYFDLPPNDGVKPSKFVNFLQALIREIEPEQTGFVFPWSSDEGGQRKIVRHREPRRLVFRLEGGGLTESILFKVELRFVEADNRYNISVL